MRKSTKVHGAISGQYSTVVSKKNAAIEVRKINLSESDRRSLSAHTDSLPPANKPAK